MKKKRFPPVWQPGEGLALMIFRRVLTNQAWLRLSVPAAYRMNQKGWDVIYSMRERVGFVKVEKILKGSLDSISSPSVKIQITYGRESKLKL